MWLERIRNVALISLLLTVFEAVAVLVIFSGPSFAHEASPTLIDITPQPDRGLSVLVRQNPRNFLARLDGLEHDAYLDLPSDIVAARLNRQPEALASAIQMRGTEGELTIAVKGVDPTGRWDISVFDAPENTLELAITEAIGDALIRVLDPETGSPLQTVFVSSGGNVRLLLGENQTSSPVSVARKYLRSGFDHILPKGLDHILFVVGLFLLSPALRPLLTQVSLFTVAHTATLGMAASGLVTVPSAVVEPLIAASIAFIAVENLFRASLSRWRLWVVFGFGLLHGLGFASVLSEFGLPADQFALALAAFNLGVEFGQLTILALCFFAAGLLFHKSWYRAAISIPLSVLLAGIGLYWSVERIVEGLA